MGLDKIDARIVREMQNNVRLSNKELAARVGLSPSSCLERVRKLTDEGVFTGFHAHVRPQSLGAGIEALIGIRLNKHTQQVVRTFWSHLMGLPEVKAAFHVAGAFDFQAHVVVKDTEHLRKFVLESLAANPHIGRVETALMFNSALRPVLPNYLAPER